MAQKTAADQIFAKIKGLREHLQPGEEPLLSMPAIWDGGESKQSTPCDIILTNQRLIGYYSVRFPRPRLFLESIDLATITSVSLRQKTFEPVFHELLISSGRRKVYIRAPRRKIEILYNSLRSAPTGDEATLAGTSTGVESHSTPIYGRQEIRMPFETSPLAITLLFVGGIILEIIGGLLWTAFGMSTGLPLCIAGLLAVIIALAVRRQQQQ